MSAERAPLRRHATRLDSLGEMLAARREARGLTMRDVAAETGISLNTVHRIEHGKAPSVHDFFVLARWLDVPVAWFEGQGGEPEASAYARGWDDCAARVAAALERSPLADG